jgi:2-amino-4-hydroxy-6-hydroxymethyldihydropteridine diphosphokinase
MKPAPQTEFDTTPPAKTECEECVYVALGANLGERQATLDAALRALNAVPGVRVLRISPWLETAAVGGPSGQPPYLNGVAELRCTLSPRELLEALLKIERDLGRVRDPHDRNAARTLDLDIVFFGNKAIDEPGLQIPHPRAHERRFVLEPLAALAPELRHPGLKKSVREMLALQLG